MTIDSPRPTDAGLGTPDDILRVENLSVEFLTERGWLRVVDGVSFAVPPGRTMGLVGESGSGKTVTSLAVMGLLPRGMSRCPTGSIRLLGRELLGLKDGQLADVRGSQMAMIFQEPRRSLDPAFTVGDQIADVLVRHEGSTRRVAWKRAVEMLDTVGIADADRRARNYPHQFSGGMCQRVMLAIALACRPTLLIADEPTTALDVTVQAEMLRLMNDLQHQLGISILFITHDLGVVAEMCDSVAVMYAGQIVEAQAMHDLFESPGHPYTEGLLAAIPDHHVQGERLRSIPGQVPPAWALPSGCRFHPRCPHAQEGRCDVATVELEGPPEHQVRCVRFRELALVGVRS